MEKAATESAGHLVDGLRAMPELQSKKSDPLVSVVIPTYNYGRYVCDAVDSALAQTYPNIEVIVVDDGSTDDTRQRLQRYRSKIRYIYQDNRGPGAARNTAIRAARGEWIALLDADDTWAEDKTERQLQVAAEKGWDLVISWNSPGDSHCAPEPRELGFDDLFFVRCRSSSWLVRRRSLLRAGLFDESLTGVEDRDMMLRLGPGGKLGVIYGNHMRRRSHAGSTSRNAKRTKQNFGTLVRASLSWPELRRRPLFRAMLRSYVHWDAAKEYASGGHTCTALWELTLAFLKYPLPARKEYCRPLQRLKFGVRLLLQLAGIWTLMKVRPAAGEAAGPFGGPTR